MTTPWRPSTIRSPQLVRDYRSARQLASTYGADWYADALHDGRIYAGWKQIGADSGRMACKDPNLQNLPRDIRYRRCFAAPPAACWSRRITRQIELRIAAKIAGDKAMLDAYGKGMDLHTATARLVLGVQDVTKAQRQLAKAINFGLLYGMGAKGFRTYAQSNYGVDADRGRGRHATASAFFDAYPGLGRGIAPSRTAAVGHADARRPPPAGVTTIHRQAKHACSGDRRRTGSRRRWPCCGNAGRNAPVRSPSWSCMTRSWSRPTPTRPTRRRRG